MLKQVRIPVIIQGAKHEALLDTGSSVSLIDSDIASQLSLVLDRNRTTVIRSASSHTFTHFGTTEVGLSLPTISSTKKFPIQLHCLKRLNAGIILGLDFLSANQARIDFSNSTISMHAHTLELQPPTNTSTDSFDPDDLFVFNQIETPDMSMSRHAREWHNSFLETYGDMIGSDAKLGIIKDTAFQIQLESGIRPFHFKPYRIPASQEEEFKRQLTNLVEQGVIRKSTSPYASPAFAVAKKDSSLRMVVDYRHLNQHTILDYYPIPNQQDLLFSLHGNHVFSQIDCNSGYFQICLHPDSIPLTAFITPFGKYEYLRVPQGLSGAPMYFQRIMNDHFSHLPFVKVFMDDILHNVADHADHLHQVMAILRSFLSMGFDPLLEIWSISGCCQCPK